MPTQRDFTTLAPVGSVDTSTSPPVLAVPAGLAVGDLLLVAVFFGQGTGGGGDAGTGAGTEITTPPGMTLYSNYGTTENRAGAIFATVITDPADFAGGIPLGANTASTRVAAVAQAWTPDPDVQWDLGSVSCLGPEWGTAMNSDLFPALSRDLVLGISMTNKSANLTLTVHSPMGGGVDTRMATAPSAASGSVSDSATSVTTGGTGVTFNTLQANGQTYAFGINQVSGPPPVPELPEVTGHGFTSVEQVLQTPGATWAHRNLGLTFPEMTEYGVRSAANAGFGIIEVSVHRTSDGVFIGSHDPTPDRVTIETTHDGQTFANLTSEQVLALRINVGPVGAPQHYATLEQLVATLPDDFVYLVDHKTGTDMGAFLDLLDSILGPSRAIVKIDGSAPVSRFELVKSRGYTTAAYWYDTSNWETIPGKMPYVDLPGLNYNADQSFWDELLTYGKPIWGHVCPNQDAADMAMAKGATFVQCTSVSINPVGVESWVEPPPPDPEPLPEPPIGGTLLEQEFGDWMEYIQVEAYAGSGAWEESFANPELVPAFWQFENRVVITSDGKTVTSSTQIVASVQYRAVLNEGARVRLPGDLRDYRVASVRTWPGSDSQVEVALV